MDRAFDDIPSLKSLFDLLSNERLERMFNNHDLYAILYEMRVYPTENKFTKIQQIREELAKAAPKVVEDAPDEGPITCQCEIPEGLRWVKANNAEPVTVSVDLTDAPEFDFNVREGIDIVMAQAFGESINIDLKMIESGRGDIHIQFRPIDGSGGRLGATWQPTEGYDMDAGISAGDITFDTGELWTPPFFASVLIHELGHAVGLPHAPELNNIMFPQYRGVRLEWGEWDLEQLNERYPQEEEPVDA